MSTPKLYRTYSVIEEYDGFKDVCVNWFIIDRKEPVAPYEELIQDYQDLRDKSLEVYGNESLMRYSEDAANELFTAEEVEMLRHYLKYDYEIDMGAKEEEIPIPSDLIGHVAIQVGGPQRMLYINTAEIYDLPFAVWGYLDLRRHEETEQRKAEGIISTLAGEELSPTVKEMVIKALQDDAVLDKYRKNRAVEPPDGYEPCDGEFDW